MDEESIEFNQFNLQIFPPEAIVYGMSYLMVILAILLKTKENQGFYKDMLK